MGRSRRRLIFRSRADSDIDHQLEYFAIEAGLVTARRFLQALRKTCGALQESPELGRIRRVQDQRLEGIRFWPVAGFRRHLIFYIPTDTAIDVVRVLHGARDIERLLYDHDDW